MRLATASLFAFAFIARPLSAAAQPCSHDCDISIRMQHNGCCPPPARPPRPPTPSRCAAGQHRSAGHCCAEGEDWVPQRRSCVCMDIAVCGSSQTPAPSHTPAPTVAGTCPEGMVSIPAGTFWMGSPEGSGYPDEHPQHRVSVPAFCMDRTEVTVDAYATCVSSGTCAPAATTVTWPNITEADRTLPSRWCNANFGGRGNHPVNCVDWTQADAYCTSRGGRLPTEEEWEYAARGTDGRTYPWGNESPDATRLNACGSECAEEGRRAGQTWSPMYNANDGWPTTAPVGSFPEGVFGLRDMAGNVWEWTSSPYGPYSGGWVDRTLRVHRGGSWDFADPSWVRAASRYWHAVSYRNCFLGFRCARGVL